MSERLTSLPWVEQGSVNADGRRRQAKFTVKDRNKFNMDEVRKALGWRYADGVKVLAGPTEK